MSKTLLALGTIALLGSLMMINQPNSVDFPSKFESFKQKYGKRYGTTEDAYRLAVYTQNVLYAQAYNMQKGRDVFGETIFFDLTDEEFAETYLTLKVTEEDLNVERVTLRSNNLAQEIDWTLKGAVTDIKDQGQCGSCWTFGTTGVLEGFFFINTGTLPNLSEQQLLDCSTWVDLNFGCNGGLPARAIGYVSRNGLTTQENYPYKAVQGTCSIKGGAFKVTGSTALAADEQSFLTALNKQPVSVGVDATNWKYYDPQTDKIFSECEASLNHAVLAVGYNEQSYKIKNSWGTAWGDKGFIHLARGNTCGVWNTNIIVYK